MHAHRPPLIDIHVHLAGQGDGGTGCYIAPRYRRDIRFRTVLALHGLLGAARRGELDGAYRELLVRAVDGCAGLDGIVALGMDPVYRADGSVDEGATGMVVPDDYLFEVARAHPRIHPGPSVHPDRPGALDDLERCKERGAVLIKWIPCSQGMDPSARRHRPFYRKLVELGLPLLSHTGLEGALPVVSQSLGDPGLLEGALAEGVTVIAAHCARGIALTGRRWYAEFKRLLLTYPNFFGDVSALDVFVNVLFFTRLRREGADLLGRLAHGSDYPLPVLAGPLLPFIGPRAAWRVQKEKNLLRRAVMAKRAFGLPESVFTLGAELLGLPSAAPAG